MATVTRSYEWGSVPKSTFRSRTDWSLKWWVMLAVILSFVFHGILYVGVSVLDIGPSSASRQLPIEDFERVKINPDLLKQQDAIREIPQDISPAEKPDLKAFEPNLDAFDKAQMIPENQEIDLTPNVKEITNFIRADDPAEKVAGDASAESMAEMLAPKTAAAAPDLATEMASVRRDILSKPVSEKQMLLDAGALDPGEGGNMDIGLLDQVKKEGSVADAAGTRVKGFSNLDDLLGHGGQVGGSTAPILMPTDLLFEYGSDQLAEGARLSLMKLGFLIQRNPDSLFIIEGHTDTFGSDAFNLELSQRRANAVVGWLVSSLRLGTDRVRAVGMGEAQPIVNPSGTVEEQALNRRVEIKVRPRQ